MSTLTRLQTWYAAQCDGEWEHLSGIRIDSCDNPGWWVKIDLRGTRLQNREFTEVAEGVDNRHCPIGPRWLNCRVENENGTWLGAGDETQLERILEMFLAWAEEMGD